MRLRRSLIVLLALLISTVPRPAAAAGPRDGDPELFPQTQHTLAFTFRAFYDTHGGLPIVGYPLTEVFPEDGRPVQYFERARLEWHADLGLVLAGHLGRWAAEQQGQQPAFQPLAGAEAAGLD